MTTENNKSTETQLKYSRMYYHTVKKYKNKQNKPTPIKTCQICGNLLVDVKSYKQNVCLKPNGRSECQIKRDSLYNKSKKCRSHKKPKGIFSKYNVSKKRECLRCYKKFTSQSLHNRICDVCKNQQPDIMNFHNISLDTHNINNLFN